MGRRLPIKPRGGVHASHTAAAFGERELYLRLDRNVRSGDRADRAARRGVAHPSASGASVPWRHRAKGQRVQGGLSPSGHRTQGRPEHPAHYDGRYGFRRVEHVRRPHSYPDPRSHRRQWTSLQQFPYHGAVFADAGGPSYRPESPFGRLRQHLGVRHGLSGIQLRSFPGAPEPSATFSSTTGSIRRGSASII